MCVCARVCDKHCNVVLLISIKIPNRDPLLSWQMSLEKLVLSFLYSCLSVCGVATLRGGGLLFLFKIFMMCSVSFMSS